MKVGVVRPLATVVNAPLQPPCARSTLQSAPVAPDPFQPSAICWLPEAVAFSFLDLVHAGKQERDWFATMTPVFEELAKPNYGTRVNYKKEPVGKSPPLPAGSYAGTYHNNFVGDAVVAEEDSKLVLKLGPKLRAFSLTHFDRDTFTYQPEGEMSAGLSAVTSIQ